MIDLVNGTFETLGAIIIASQARDIYREKIVRGVSWTLPLFFLTWGLWNPFYYSSLGQWFSFTGGVLIVTANFVYFSLLIYYEDRGVLVTVKNRVQTWYKYYEDRIRP